MLVTILPVAAHDMESIGDYIAKDNPWRAVSFVQELRKATAVLGDFPEAFPLVPDFEDDGIRMHTHGRYVIYYRYIEASKRVVVLRVLHGAQDRQANL